MNSLKNKIPHSFRVRYGSKWHKISDPLNLKIQISYSKIKRQFVRPPFPKLKNGEINLHLGCGSINHPKFINIDGLPAPHIHYIRAIDKLSPFPDNSVNLIYACHCLEHFRYKEVSKVLTEWFRTLKQGGILRLSVPNFDVLVDVYAKNNKNVDSIIEQLMGGQDHKYNYHLTVFNQLSLKNLLKDIGFKNVRKWQPGSDEYTTFNDFSTYEIIFNGFSYPISLNLEAEK